MQFKSKVSIWFLLLFVSFIWGISFYVRNISLIAYSEFQVALLQVFFTFIFFIPFIIKFFKKINRKNIFIVAISAFVGNALTSLFFALGQDKISSSISGILSALIPILTLLISILFFKYRSNWKAWLGIIISFTGIVIIMTIGDNQGINYFLGFVYIFLAVLFASLNINIISFIIKDLNGTEIAALSFMIIGPPAGIIFFVGTDLSIPLHHIYFAKSTWMLLALAAITCVGAISYNVLIKVSSHIFASFAAYLIPIVAILVGVFIGNESLTYLHIVATLIIFIGIYWSSSK